MADLPTPPPPTTTNLYVLATVSPIFLVFNQTFFTFISLISIPNEWFFLLIGVFGFPVEQKKVLPDFVTFQH
jgi:hypothetical protein